MWLEVALRVFTRLTAIKTSVAKSSSSQKKTHTPVLDNTIKLPYLRTTLGTQKQKGKKRYPI